MYIEQLLLYIPRGVRVCLMPIDSDIGASIWHVTGRPLVYDFGAEFPEHQFLVTSIYPVLVNEKPALYVNMVRINSICAKTMLNKLYGKQPPK